MKIIRIVFIVSFVSLSCASASAEAFLAFRTGVNTGAINFNSQDYLFSSANAADWGYSNGYDSANREKSTRLTIDDDPSNRDTFKAWLGFTELFGSGAGQIAEGSTIQSATLRFTLIQTNKPETVTLGLHRIINDANDWFGEATTNTWRYLNKGNSESWKNLLEGNVTYMSQASVVTAESGSLTASSPLYTTIDIDVTASLNAWSVSTTGDNKNMGWAMWLNSATTAINLASPSFIYDGSSLNFRPTLLVNVVPEPAALSLITLIGLLSLFIHRRFRK